MNEQTETKGGGVKVNLTYQEREAILVLRKALKTKPQIATLLLMDASRDAAVAVMKTISSELQSMLEVNRAFSAVAAELVRIDNEQKKAQATQGETE